MLFRVIFLVLVAMSAPLGRAQRAIPDDNLAYPVLINLSECPNNSTLQATGFFLSTKSVVYLVTARHVVFNESVNPAPKPLLCKRAELLSYSRDPKETQLNRFSVDLQLLNQSGKVKQHLTHDVAVVQVGVIDASTPAPALPTPVSAPKPAVPAGPTGAPQRVNVIPGVAIRENAPSGILSVSMDAVELFDKVLTPNDIYVLGYPSSIGLQQVPQISYSAPLLRKGVVAGTNSVNKTIVLDCMTFHGNSGAPVLEVIHQGFQSQFRLIGVVSQYVPVAETWLNMTQNYTNVQVYNSGYSIAEPMDAVVELVAQ